MRHFRWAHVKKALGRDPKDITEDLEFLDAEMDDCTEEYANFVMEQLEAARNLCVDPRLMIEERLDFSRWVPHGFGTGDAVIVADHELHIIDFKYGVGVLVEAEGNPQMRCYALGALDTYDGIYDIETVKMTIFQPRTLRIFRQSVQTPFPLGVCKRNVSTTQMGVRQNYWNGRRTHYLPRRNSPT